MLSDYKKKERAGPRQTGCVAQRHVRLSKVRGAGEKKPQGRKKTQLGVSGAVRLAETLGGRYVTFEIGGGARRNLRTNCKEYEHPEANSSIRAKKKRTRKVAQNLVGVRKSSSYCDGGGGRRSTRRAQSL